MAFGIGKAIKKAWKGTFGKLEDKAKPYLPVVAGAALGALTGGLGFAASGVGSSVFGSLGAAGSSFATGAIAGGAVGALHGGMQYQSIRQQEKAHAAQLASAEKIAQMQQATVISAAPPTQTSDNSALTEANNASKKARAFRLANSVRGNTLGGGGSSSNKKRTLG